MRFGEAPQPWVERLFRAPPTQGSEVLRQALASAETGNIEAQVALGRGYLLGLPAMKRDVEEARFWFTRALGAGQREADSTLQSQAAYFLGVMARNQAGSNALQAPLWFERAAALGSAEALFALGNFYADGIGVPKDEARAVALYHRAAERAFAPALQRLAMAYERGELGLPADDEAARRFAFEAEHANRPLGLP
jgi:TPR repeat protein